MTQEAQRVREWIISHAATEIIQKLGLEPLGDTWLAVRRWIMRPSPRRSVQQFLDGVEERAMRRERKHHARLSYSDPSELDARCVEPGDPAAEIPAITRTEEKLVRLLSRGLTYQEIGAKLGISSASVARRVAAIRRRMGR